MKLLFVAKEKMELPIGVIVLLCKNLERGGKKKTILSLLFSTHGHGAGTSYKISSPKINVTKQKDAIVADKFNYLERYPPITKLFRIILSKK